MVSTFCRRVYGLAALFACALLVTAVAGQDDATSGLTRSCRTTKGLIDGQGLTNRLADRYCRDECTFIANMNCQDGKFVGLLGIHDLTNDQRLTIKEHGAYSNPIAEVRAPLFISGSIVFVDNWMQQFGTLNPGLDYGGFIVMSVCMCFLLVLHQLTLRPPDDGVGESQFSNDTVNTSLDDTQNPNTNHLGSIFALSCSVAVGLLVLSVTSDHLFAYAFTTCMMLFWLRNAQVRYKTRISINMDMKALFFSLLVTLAIQFAKLWWLIPFLILLFIYVGYTLCHDMTSNSIYDARPVYLCVFFYTIATVMHAIVTTYSRDAETQPNFWASLIALVKVSTISYSDAEVAITKSYPISAHILGLAACLDLLGLPLGAPAIVIVFIFTGLLLLALRIVIGQLYLCMIPSTGPTSVINGALGYTSAFYRAPLDVLDVVVAALSGQPLASTHAYLLPAGVAVTLACLVDTRVTFVSFVIRVIVAYKVRASKMVEKTGKFRKAIPQEPVDIGQLLSVRPVTNIPPLPQAFFEQVRQNMRQLTRKRVGFEIPSTPVNVYIHRTMDEAVVLSSDHSVFTQGPTSIGFNGNTRDSRFRDVLFVESKDVTWAHGTTATSVYAKALKQIKPEAFSNVPSIIKAHELVDMQYIVHFPGIGIPRTHPVPDSFMAHRLVQWDWPVNLSDDGTPFFGILRTGQPRLLGILSVKRNPKLEGIGVLFARQGMAAYQRPLVARPDVKENYIIYQKITDLLNNNAERVRQSLTKLTGDSFDDALASGLTAQIIEEKNKAIDELSKLSEQLPLESTADSVMWNAIVEALNCNRKAPEFVSLGAAMRERKRTTSIQSAVESIDLTVLSSPLHQQPADARSVGSRGSSVRSSPTRSTFRGRAATSPISSGDRSTPLSPLRIFPPRSIHSEAVEEADDGTMDADSERSEDDEDGYATPIGVTRPESGSMMATPEVSRDLDVLATPEASPGAMNIPLPVTPPSSSATSTFTNRLEFRETTPPREPSSKRSFLGAFKHFGSPSGEAKSAVSSTRMRAASLVNRRRRSASDSVGAQATD